MPLEEGTALHSDLEDVVCSQLTSIANKIIDLKECAALHLSSEANDFWSNWQKVQEDMWTATNDGNYMQIFNRLNPAVVKLCMLFELGSPDFDLTRPIRLEFVQEACRLVDTYRIHSAKAAYDIVGDNVEKNVNDRIVAYLKNHNGKAKRNEILRDVKIKGKDFDEYLETMLVSGEVETRTVNRGGKGRDSTYIFLLNPSNVDNVANIAKISNIAIIEKISSVIVKKDASTLAMMAMKPIVATKANDGLKTATEDRISVDGEDEHSGTQNPGRRR